LPYQNFHAKDVVERRKLQGRLQEAAGKTAESCREDSRRLRGRLQETAGEAAGKTQGNGLYRSKLGKDKYHF
jgi:hypothetical protein